MSGLVILTVAAAESSGLATKLERGARGEHEVCRIFENKLYTDFLKRSCVLKGQLTARGAEKHVWVEPDARSKVLLCVNT